MYDPYQGFVAKKYIILRMRDLPHFEKNAEGIHTLFLKVEQHADPRERIDVDECVAFCHDLSKYTFGHAVDRTMHMSDTRFGYLCYIFSVYISYFEGYMVGSSGKEVTKLLSKALELPLSDVICFSKNIVEDLYAMYEDDISIVKVHVA